MKALLNLIALWLITSGVVQAAQPAYFHWDEVTLKEGDFTVRARIDPDTSNLEFLTIDTPNGRIEIAAEELEEIKEPRLDTFSFALMPFLIDGEYRYLYQLSVRFSPSSAAEHRTCIEELDGEFESWAPGRIFYVIFADGHHTTNWATLECDD